MLEKLSLDQGRAKIHVAVRQRLSSRQPLSTLPQSDRHLPEESIIARRVVSEHWEMH
jgi:hypothetical protein